MTPQISSLENLTDCVILNDGSEKNNIETEDFYLILNKFLLDGTDTGFKLSLYLYQIKPVNPLNKR